MIIDHHWVTRENIRKCEWCGMHRSSLKSDEACIGPVVKPNNMAMSVYRLDADGDMPL